MEKRNEPKKMNMYQPIHSDFIIHWTGKKDIDDKYDRCWSKKHSSQTSQKVTELYLERLKNTLEYGLWMTKNEEDKFVTINNEQISRPWPARTCFSELRLSKARSHAQEFGRLGIGFKRFFLFNRFGAPMVYYQPHRKNMCFPPFLSWRDDNNKNAYFPCFLKPMTKISEKDNTLEYKFFDESEWRIIYSKEIKERLEKHNCGEVTKYFTDPNEIKNNEFREYASKVQRNGGKKPEYLIPLNLDRWFAMIIYPSLAVKVEAEADKNIRSLIERLKPTKSPEEKLSSNAAYEKYNKPIEIDLDACRNF